MMITKAVEELRSRLRAVGFVRTVGVAREAAEGPRILIWSYEGRPPVEVEFGRWRGWPVEVVTVPRAPSVLRIPERRPAPVTETVENPSL